MRSLGILVGGSLAVWGLMIGPALWLAGDDAWLQTGVAWALCLVPAIGSMAWLLWTNPAPEQRLVAVMGGTGIRLAVVLGGGFLLTQNLPESFPKIFWLWVGLFYMLVLAIEVILVVRTNDEKQETGTRN